MGEKYNFLYLCNFYYYLNELYIKIEIGMLGEL